MSKRAFREKEQDASACAAASHDRKFCELGEFGRQASRLLAMVQGASDVATPPLVSQHESAATRAWATKTAAAIERALIASTRLRLAVTRRATEPLRSPKLPAHTLSWEFGPEEGESLIEIHIRSRLLLKLIHSMLGGGAEATGSEDRDLTQIETRFAARITCEIAAELQKAWTSDAASPWTASMKSLPDRTVGSGDSGNWHSFALQIADDRFEESLAVSINHGLMADQKTGAAFPGMTTEQAGGAPVRLAARLLQAEVPRDQIEGLEAGDVISTDISPDDAIDVTLNGTALLEGRIGTRDGRKAIRLD